MRRSNENANSAKHSNAASTPTERNTVKESLIKEIARLEALHNRDIQVEIRDCFRFSKGKTTYNAFEAMVHIDGQVLIGGNYAFRDYESYDEFIDDLNAKITSRRFIFDEAFYEEIANKIFWNNNTSTLFESPDKDIFEFKKDGLEITVEFETGVYNGIWSAYAVCSELDDIVDTDFSSQTLRMYLDELCEKESDYFLASNF